MDTLERMKQLQQQGFFCSQILMQLGLELQGKDNPDLIRAMNGLAGGLGFVGETCGALTSGSSLLGVYAGKGKPTDDENFQLNLLISELVQWFKDTYGKEYGGIRCAEILGEDAHYMAGRCPIMVAGTFQKVKELLVENGYPLEGTDDD